MCVLIWDRNFLGRPLPLQYVRNTQQTQAITHGTHTHTCRHAEQELILRLQTTIYHQGKEQRSKQSRGTDGTKGGREIIKTKKGGFF